MEPTRRLRFHVATYQKGRAFAGPYLRALRAVFRVLEPARPSYTGDRGGKRYDVTEPNLVKLEKYYADGFDQMTSICGCLDGPLPRHESLSRFRVVMTSSICAIPLVVQARRDAIRSRDSRLDIAHGPPTEPTTDGEPATLNIEIDLTLTEPAIVDELQASLPATLARCATDSEASSAFIDVGHARHSMHWMDVPTIEESADAVKWDAIRRHLDGRIRGLSWASSMSKEAALRLVRSSERFAVDAHEDPVRAIVRFRGTFASFAAMERAPVWSQVKASLSSPA